MPVFARGIPIPVHQSRAHHAYRIPTALRVASPEMDDDTPFPRGHIRAFTPTHMVPEPPALPSSPLNDDHDLQWYIDNLPTDPDILRPVGHPLHNLEQLAAEHSERLAQRRIMDEILASRSRVVDQIDHIGEHVQAHAQGRVVERIGQHAQGQEQVQVQEHHHQAGSSHLDLDQSIEYPAGDDTARFEQGYDEGPEEIPFHRSRSHFEEPADDYVWPTTYEDQDDEDVHPVHTRYPHAPPELGLTLASRSLAFAIEDPPVSTPATRGSSPVIDRTMDEDDLPQVHFQALDEEDAPQAQVQAQAQAVEYEVDGGDDTPYQSETTVDRNNVTCACCTDYDDFNNDNVYTAAAYVSTANAVVDDNGESSSHSSVSSTHHGDVNQDTQEVTEGHESDVNDVSSSDVESNNATTAPTSEGGSVDQDHISEEQNEVNVGIPGLFLGKAPSGSAHIGLGIVESTLPVFDSDSDSNADVNNKVVQAPSGSAYIGHGVALPAVESTLPVFDSDSDSDADVNNKVLQAPGPSKKRRAESQEVEVLHNPQPVAQRRRLTFGDYLPAFAFGTAFGAVGTVIGLMQMAPQ